MRYLAWLVALFVLTSSISAQAQEIRSLADCALKVFNGISRNHVWTGEKPDGCLAEVHVDKRAEGVFVTVWNSSVSTAGWSRLSLSVAMGFFEVADGKSHKEAGRDILARSARIGGCLDSILRANDPLECRDYATKTYSAGEELGVEHKRSIWLDDGGRHVVVEYAHGDTRASVSAPADLFGGQALPPGAGVDIHVLDFD
ncbi:MAG: hypothetical protein A2X82_15310 [Geobacteraceae bacterium GWC2_55_20]|nr:MAG: hypothetical protein A2X82_15310 [Geobacteraceae bacterium GWC2_55_20]HCE68958.1 hypothetical protein [Geobacter sp.]